MKRITIISATILFILWATTSYIFFSRYFFGFRDTSRFFCRLTYSETFANHTETILDSNLYTGETKTLREPKPGRKRNCLFGPIREEAKPTPRVIAQGTKPRPRINQTPQTPKLVQHPAPPKEPEINCYTVTVPRPAEPKIIYDDSMPEGKKVHYSGRDGAVFRCDGSEDRLMFSGYPDELVIGTRKPTPKPEPRPKKKRTPNCSKCYHLQGSAFQACMMACSQ